MYYLFTSHSWPMESRTDSPIAVSVEEHSNFVILTYFQGDINSMVDAHFNRALKKDYSAKESAIKTKKHSKTIKLGESINLTLHGFTLTAESASLSSFFDCLSLSLQRTQQALVRALLLTPTQCHRSPLHHVCWPSPLQTILLAPGLHSLPGQERAQGCRQLHTPCPQMG